MLLVCKELKKVPLYRIRKVLIAPASRVDPLYERVMAQGMAQDAETAGYCRDVF